MQVVAAVQARGVDVEAVAVLHDELAHAQQAGLGPRLITELGLDLVPDLRQLLVAAQLVARDGGHHLLVRHGEAQLRALAVLQAEHVVAHSGPAARLLPEFGGVQRGEQELLADPVHLLADDGGDLVQRALAERQIAVDSGAELANVSGAKQELMTGDLGVGGSLAEGGDEELGPTMHSVDCIEARRS